MVSAYLFEIAYNAVMSDKPETMLELQSAADALGVHYQTAYRWVRSGRLPAQLTGGKYLVSAHDVAEVHVHDVAPDAAVLADAPPHQLVEACVLLVQAALLAMRSPVARADDAAL